MSDAWRPATRYPYPAVEVLDPRFEHYRLKSAAVERVATDAAGRRVFVSEARVCDRSCRTGGENPVSLRFRRSVKLAPG